MDEQNATVVVTEHSDGTLSAVPVSTEEIQEVEIDEEIPAWVSDLLEANRETNRLLAETLAEVRTQAQAYSTLVPSLLETNARLTSQLQEMPAAMIAALSPLLTQQTLPETQTPLTDTPKPEGEETAQSEVVLVEEVKTDAPQEKPRRKYRFL